MNCESLVNVMSLIVVLFDWSMNSRCYWSSACRDVIGCDDCMFRSVIGRLPAVLLLAVTTVRFDPSFISQMSVFLLLVKLVDLSIVCPSISRF